MKKPSIATLLSLVGIILSVPSGARAQQEALIAGWDFSQYSNLGFLTTDGATLVATLTANHSDLDPTNGCGIESNAFGTMYLNGNFGSTSTPLSFEGLDPLQPTDVPPDGSLASNANQPQLGFGSDAACIQQQIEHMPGTNCNDVAMLAYDAVSVVFGATRAGEEGAEGSWKLSFAGRTIVSGSTSVQVQFAPDGFSYSNVGTALVTASDTEFDFELGGANSDTGYVRLVIPSTEPEASVAIDNVGIAVPEASHGALVAAAVLVALRGRRRRH